MADYDKYLVLPTSELRKLIEGHKQEFGTLEALCIDLCGGVDAAGRMLYRLLGWWQKSRHPEGWVYKSHVDWYAELRIQEKQLPKANAALALAGVETRLLKGRLPSPCKHYRLLPDQFAAALARLLRLDLTWLKNFLLPFEKSIALKMESRNPQNRQIEMPGLGTPTAGSTTDSSSLHNRNLNSKQQAAAGADKSLHDSGEQSIPEGVQEGHPPVHENAAHGGDTPSPVSAAPLPQQVEILTGSPYRLDKNVAWAYVEKYGTARAEFCAEEAIRRGNHPAGMWRYFLDTGWYKDVPEQPMHQNDDVNHATSAEDITLTREELEAEWRRRHPEPKPAAAALSGAAAQWRSAFAQLEIQIDQANFETWLRDAQFVDFEHGEDGAPGTFVIGVRNNYARDMLTHRLYSSVQRVVADRVGSDVELRFEVQGKRRDDGQDEMPLFKILANPRLYKLHTMTDEELAEALNVPVVGT